MGIHYMEHLLKYKPELARTIKDAWMEYEEGETPEAKYVKEMDKTECLIQAHGYEQKTFGEADLEEFQRTLVPKVRSSEGKELVRLLQQEREAHFAKRNRRTPVIFVIGRSSQPIRYWAFNYVIGDHAADLKRYSTLLSTDFNFQCLDLDGLMREKSEDSTCDDAQFLRYCMQENVQWPIQLVIKLLEEKINEVSREGKRWSLVCGFPENMRYLTEFQEKVSTASDTFDAYSYMQVQKVNYTLYISSLRAPSGNGQTEGESAPDVLKIRDYRGLALDVRSALAVDGYFKEVNGDGSAEDVTEQCKAAVEAILRHAKDNGLES